MFEIYPNPVNHILNITKVSDQAKYKIYNRLGRLIYQFINCTLPMSKKTNKIMLIDKNLLSRYGATTDLYKPKDIIFGEGDTPKYYYQIISGDIKLNHIDENAREIIISLLKTGDSICEFLLLLDTKYPVNATVMTESTILKITKANFAEMLNSHPEIVLDVCKFVSERLHHNVIKTKNITSPFAEVRIKAMLNFFKDLNNNDKTDYSFQVPLTRQQLAAITGLRTETVIRCIKKLEREKFLKIHNHKIFI
ncbi:Crp/Fnr family transcriptional regulator [Chryseobacterium luquanense]|uniref:Cyclic nucleotide-binding domain-containing protein n=1 Tax=Chryseobacterium luquanense TaxID=2983766 RepID=A0ABT3XY47_9FLAO|nr:Crp/Fnr family transcriptional regulator [Chryseobacterium luquanense]MCX8530819.1 cyclic nucleotide-binding domain-containing protein [Chryseobacterium luquanense]